VGDQIAVAADGCRGLLPEPRRAVEHLLDGLDGEVGMATVHQLPEGDLWFAAEVDVLCAVSYKLHESSSHGAIVHLLGFYFTQCDLGALSKVFSTILVGS